MSEAHPDAEMVKVTRTTTTYEPVETKSQPPAVRQRNRTMLWIVGACVVAVLAVAGLYYASTLNNTPAATQQNAAVASQQNAQTLSQQATTAQQAADQSAAQTRALSAAAAKDRDDARSASVGAADSRDAAATTK